MHYLAFSLGHKLHSSILLIYFVCMKQIELLHAGRSQLTDISLPSDDAVTASVLHSKCSHREIVDTAVSINYLLVYGKPIDNLACTVTIFIWSSTQTTMFLLLFLIAHHFRLSNKRILDNHLFFFKLFFPVWLLPLKLLLSLLTVLTCRFLRLFK